MKESTIEKKLKQEVEKLGGLCFKWISPGCTGVPDRIVIWPNGKVDFVELKNETGLLAKRQKFIANELKKRKANWFLITNTLELLDYLSSKQL